MVSNDLAQDWSVHIYTNLLRKCIFLHYDSILTILLERLWPCLESQVVPFVTVFGKLMALISNPLKAKLGEEIAKGHAKFGLVAPRRPYRDEEDSGDGAPGINVKTHPWLSNTPVGAASDLTFVASENSNITDEALERVEELNPELQQQPRLQAELNYSNRYTPKPKITPY